MKVLAALTLLAGCLSVPDGPTPECSTSADCNEAAGEVCDEGLCFGNPPDGMFAAAITVPTNNANAVATELPMLSIPPDGWVGDLQLAKPVTISGRVEAFCPPGGTCDRSSLGATITVKRASLFYGGPGFRKVATSKEGVAAGKTDSFSFTIPRSQPGEPPYRIRIAPDDRTATTQGPSPAELVPPLFIKQLFTSDLPSMPAILGAAQLPVISGNLVDAYGQPLKYYRVVALGRWDAGEPISEVSTVSYTADGHYSVTLSPNLTGLVEIVAKPMTGTAATLRLPGLDANASTQRNLAEPMGMGKKVSISVGVEGVSGNGAVKPVVGAKLTVTGSYVPMLSSSAHVEMIATAVTGDDGKATLDLLDGAAIAGTYRLSIIPPAGSSLGVIYNDPFTLTPGPAKRLPQRVGLKGTIVDQFGEPMSGVSVTARPALRFQWSLDEQAQQFLAAIPAATTTTPDTGEFIVSVDPVIGATWGNYDLDFEPALSAQAATWTQGDIELPRNVSQTTFSVGRVTAPDAAWIHGRILDNDGVPVQNAELRVLEISTNLLICMQVSNPGDCVIPAHLQGHGTSESDGVAKVALPRD